MFMNNKKCLVYYLDSKKYDDVGVQKSINETKKEYKKEKKEIEVNVDINEYGMYVITFYIKNKNTIFNRIRLYFRRKKNPLLQEKNNKKEVRKYGNYESACSIYYPY